MNHQDSMQKLFFFLDCLYSSTACKMFLFIRERKLASVFGRSNSIMFSTVSNEKDTLFTHTFYFTLPDRYSSVLHAFTNSQLYSKKRCLDELHQKDIFSTLIIFYNNFKNEIFRSFFFLNLIVFENDYILNKFNIFQNEYLQ